MLASFKITLKLSCIVMCFVPYMYESINKLKKIAEDNEDAIPRCYRCYKNKPLKDFVCPNGKTPSACYNCLDRKYY